MEATDYKSLKLKIFKNIGAISVIQLLSKLTTIVTGIILARLLDPADFGIYGLVVSFMAFILVFDEMGLATAVIQKKADDEEAVFYTGFFIKVLISTGLFLLILFFAAPGAALFYKTPGLRGVTIFLAVIMLIDNLKFIPQTRIVKSNALNKLLLPSLIDTFSYSVIVVFLALSGYKYWSFVYAKLISSFLGGAAFCFIMPWKPQFIFNKKLGKELLNFGKFLVLAALLGMVNKQMDNLIVGKLLGLSALGYYALAYRWGGIISLDIGQVVNQVLYPVNVKYQGNFSMLENIQAQSMKYVSLIIFPISMGFLVTCPEFVRVVLGEKWAPSIVPLQILSIHGLFWALVKRGNLFEAIGKPKYISVLGVLFSLLLIILIFPFTSWMGITGTALAVTITFIVVNFIVVWSILGRVFHFNVWNILSQLRFPFISSLIMVAAVSLLKITLYNQGYRQVTVFFLSILVGFIAYSLGISFLMVKDLKKIIRVLFTPRTSMKAKFRMMVISL